MSRRSKYWPLLRSHKLTNGWRSTVKAMKKVPLSDIKDDLSRYLRMAEEDEIIITRHGKPAGILVGFANDEDWFDYLLEHDPRFLRRIEGARASLRKGKGVKLEDLRIPHRPRRRQKGS